MSNVPKQGEIGYMPGELGAVNLTKVLADQYGYGNLISHLQRMWSEKLQVQGFPPYNSDMAAGIICPWCKIDHRTGKRAKKP
jgi:hypothetical protein